MSLVKTENGISSFAFEHSLNYQQVQMNFFTAVESLNPDNIVVSLLTLKYIYIQVTF